MTAQYSLFNTSSEGEVPVSPPGQESPKDARLFVPLATAPFDWFASGRKQWELRRLGRQFTRKHLILGRRVELRRGYHDKAGALWGTIVEVCDATQISHFFDLVDYQLVIPIARDREEAENIGRRILGDFHTPIIGFRVVLDPAIEIPLNSEFMPLVRQGRKQSTIRRGVRQIQNRIADLISGQDRLRVVVTDLDIKAFETLSDADAHRDGFKTLADLDRALRSCYPDIKPSDLVTIIGFELLELQ